MRDLICVVGKASRWGSAYLKRFTCVKGGAGSLVTGGFMYGMLVCRGNREGLPKGLMLWVKGSITKGSSVWKGWFICRGRSGSCLRFLFIYFFIFCCSQKQNSLRNHFIVTQKSSISCGGSTACRSYSVHTIL